MLNKVGWWMVGVGGTIQLVNLSRSKPRGVNH